MPLAGDEAAAGAAQVLSMTYHTPSAAASLARSSSVSAGSVVARGMRLETAVLALMLQKRSSSSQTLSEAQQSDQGRVTNVAVQRARPFA